MRRVTGVSALALCCGVSAAMAEGLSCSLSCVDACEHGPEAGRLLVVDRHATDATLIIVADEGLFPGNRMPERLSAPLGWESTAVSPSFVETSFDGVTGETVVVALPSRIGGAYGILRIEAVGPAFAATLDHRLARTPLRRKDVTVSYTGTCEVALW